ncbi:phosphotransferase [Candidatus Vidania fulgoroideae]|uniref:Phosphotransferase n=1 Tax=Candidatus Vidania fulgoroideorum TaxID=881286 RepID=A0A975AER5_9PROT|nr:phosphotransferase [Candidatus Vidania fulgoroideae]
MAVVIDINISKIKLLLKLNYNLGKEIIIKEIKEGTQNSNLLIETNKNKFVLTISETNKKTYRIYKKLSEIERKIINIPRLLKDKKGRIFFYYNRKISFLSYFIKGSKPEILNKKLIYKIAEILSRIHILFQRKSFYIKNNINLDLIRELVINNYNKLGRTEKNIAVRNIIYIYNNYKYTNHKLIPKGICHCDIFPDNIIVSRDYIYILDFHLASTEPYIYDICLYINEWCFKRRILHKNVIYFILGYIKNRKIKSSEFNNIYMFLIITSFRFWITRINNRNNGVIKNIYKAPYKYFYINNYLKFKKDKLSTFFKKLGKLIK